VRGGLSTPAGTVPLVTPELNRADKWGSYKARWGIGRMHYTVDPGLYALGSPTPSSPVFVTANYKMSFDCLREALPVQEGWILVLDTSGINVWCAAGKGTFGTEELVSRIQSSNLARVVNHRTLIVPQLGAPGVAAHIVKKLSGFKVVYGPIEARDLPAFLAAGMKASKEMRSKTFTTPERAALIPIELVAALKTALLILPVALLIAGLTGPKGFWTNLLGPGVVTASGVFAAILGGTVLTPLLLPWLPGRAFSWKGLMTGIVAAFIFHLLRGPNIGTAAGAIETAAWFLLIPSISAYLAMNFTGASTYTSLSGVQREMRWAFPAQVASVALGICLWLAARFLN
jgi:hypothetical protein